MKTVVIELHGFNGSYIDNKITPFLCNLADRFGANSIEPPFGPDALTTLWTGVYPKRHDEFFKFAYHGNKFNLQSIFPYTLCNLIFNGYRLFKGYDFLTRLAPEKKTGLFSVHKKYHYCHPGGLNAETLFDILRENEKTFLFYEHPCLATDKSSKLLIAPGRDKDREKRFVSEIKQNEKDFYFILLREADVLGHQFGPGSREVNQVLKIQDHIVENIIAHFSLETDNIIILSSYGMVPVIDHVDIESKLPEFGDGYIYFLDSTFARFWFYNTRTKEKVMDILNGINQGHILTESEKRHYKVDFEHNRFGEEFFLLKYGFVISPNFFNKKTEKGMHSYDLSNKDGNEFGILIANKSLCRAKLVDIMPTLLDVMKIKYNSELDGSSLLT